MFSHSRDLAVDLLIYPNREEIKKVTLYHPKAADEIAASWKTDSRWKGITRPYAAKDVARLRGTLQIEYTLARLGAERLWNLLPTTPDRCIPTKACILPTRYPIWCAA